MNNIINDKIKIINKKDNYNANFIVKVLKAYEKKQEEIEINKKITDIIKANKSKNFDNINNYNIINLDEIWVKPYLYTKMRVKLEKLVNYVINTENSYIINNPTKFYKKAIFNSAEILFEKPANQIDIVEFIKSLNIKTIETSEKFIFCAEKIDEESLFKEKYLKKAINIIKITDLKQKYSLIYDELCEYLNDDFLQNEYCDFKNNKCISQRKHRLYPPCRKNGCCFMKIRKCPNLKEGRCSVQCLPCKLFSCKYLEKRGIEYYGRELILLQAFFNKKQRKHLVFDFYISKDEILDKVYKCK